MDKLIYRSKLGCIITPYRKRQSPILEKNTALFDKVYYKWIDYVGFILPYKGTNAFITYNRDYSELARLLPNYEISNLPVTHIQKIKHPIHLTGIEKFKDAQSEIIGEIERTKNKENVWFVNLQTGEGKTILSVYLSTVFKLKTWVLCYSDDILQQWVDTYKNVTDIDINRVIRVNGKIIDKILDGSLDPDDFDIFLCTPTLLDRLGSSRNDYGKIGELFDRCGIGFLIYDEAHKNVSNIVKINAVTNVKYQIYLSADFGQGNYEKEMMYKAIFKNVPVLHPSGKLQKSLRYTKIVVVGYNTYPNAIEQNEPFNKYGYDAELYMKYQFKKGVIIDAILHVLRSILSTDTPYRSLILFNNIEHVDKMYEIVKREFPDIVVGRYYGSISKEEKLKTKEDARIIVATYGSFSTGIDAQDIKFVLSTNQCNKIADNQSAGRARPLSDGSDAMYFMFVDNGFAYCKRKLRVRLAYLTETKSKNDKPYNYPYHPDTMKGT